MELGLALSNIGRHLTREATVTLARAAEELGFASVWTSEHLVVPAALFDPFGQIFDSLTTLTYVAAVTERVRLGTSVLILPLHEPVLLAKQAATLHALSGGRLRLGVGVGWLPEEFTLAGADFAGRAAVMDHHLAVLRHLLQSVPTGPAPAPPGFEGVPFAPAVESPLPILVGGHAPPALRRAARTGDGWHGVWLEPDEVPHYIEQTRGRSERAGFTISVRVEFGLDEDGGPGGGARQLIGSSVQLLDQLRSYEAAGVDELVIDFMDADHGGVPDLPEMLDQLRRFSDLVGARSGDLRLLDVEEDRREPSRASTASPPPAATTRVGAGLLSAGAQAGSVGLQPATDGTAVAVALLLDALESKADSATGSPTGPRRR